MGQKAPGVVLKVRLIIQGVGNLDQIAVGVVLHGCYAALGVGSAGYLVEDRVIGIGGGSSCACRCAGKEVAV